MQLIDFILFPLYVLLFNLIFSARRKRIKDPLLQKYHRHGFWIKVFSSIAFTIFYLYISPGDSTSLYFPEGKNIFNLVLKNPVNNLHLMFTAGKDFDESYLLDPGNIGYFKSESNFFITRLVSILSFFSFARYIIINLFFSMIAFSGVWRLFKFFYEQYPHLHKPIAIATIYLPTFVFWSSGILKDPICIGMLGWMTYALYQAFYKRVSFIKNISIAIFTGYILAVVKVYILISYLPFFLLFLILKNVRLIKNTFGKLLLGFGFIVLGIVGFFVVADRLKEELGFFAVDKLAESVKTQQSNFINIADQAESSFSLGVEFDGSTGSLLKMAPAAIIATLYRPFLWESKKLSTLLSSLESLALMIFTLYVFFKAGPIPFFFSLFKDPMIFFAFFFSILFALFVGATTLNFGTLVRYKIPCLPFYVMAMVLIFEVCMKKKNSLIVEKNTT